MAEWPNASVLKTEGPSRGPWVRILPLPSFSEEESKPNGLRVDSKGFRQIFQASIRVLTQLASCFPNYKLSSQLGKWLKLKPEGRILNSGYFNRPTWERISPFSSLTIALDCQGNPSASQRRIWIIPKEKIKMTNVWKIFQSD